MKKTIFTLVFALTSVAAMASQTFVGWGDNSHGQLNLPAGFSGGIVDVATGHGNTILLKTDGTVIAWGYNPLGSCNVPANLSGVVRVSTFAHHCLALKGDGTVVAWGRNMDGESSVPVGLANVIGVAAGAYHSLAVKGDGTVVTWGSNYYGERDVPAGLSGVVAVTAGFCVSYAIKSDGTAVAWGLNTSGQCNIPSGLTGVIAIGAGNSHAVALKANGTVVAWGNSADGRTSVPDGLSGVTKIAAIYDHALALKSDGTVVAWGKTEHGECSIPSGLTGVTAIAAGAWHSVAIAGTLPPQVMVTLDSQGGNIIPNKVYNENAVYGTLSVPSKIGYTFDGWWSSIMGGIKIEAAASVGTSSHTLYARWKVNTVSTNQFFVGWGDNTHGQLNLPVGHTGIVAVAAGHGNTIILKNNGTVAAWGYNPLGSCNVPANLSNVVKVATYAHHCLAIKSDGKVVAWGRNIDGESNVPSALSNVVSVAAGAYHSLALKSDGTVVAWGSNYNGERIVPAGLNGVVAIAAGSCTSLAVKSDGTVVNWGADVGVPSNLTGVKAIAVGTSHYVALKWDGTVVAWGNAADGRIAVPEGLNGVIEIAAIYDHTLALKSNGTVVAWGKNDYGQCAIPMGLSGVISIAAGAAHSVAVRGGALLSTITVSFNSQGGTPVENRTYIQDSMYGVLPGPTRVGYTFAGWCIDAACSKQVSASDYVGAESHTLYAKWDSHGMLRFQKASYSIAENTDAAAVVLKVERVNGSTGPASVSYVVGNGTATNGLDYTSEVMTVSWEAGSTTARNIVIDMLDDDIYEGNETFTVRLVDATGAVLGDPAEATVTIVDNEGAPASVARFDGTLDFGAVARNSTATRFIKVWNEGNQPLAVTDVTVPEGFTVSPLAFTVRPGEFASLSVTFTPTVLGSFGGSLSIVCAGNAGASSLPVSGAGVEPPRPVAQRTITGLTAIIVVDVPEGVSVLSVEDSLPAGIVPLSISHGGSWDALNRKVKWFFDSRGEVRDRALQYTVSGSGSVIMGQVSFGEGNSYPIIGETLFEAGENPGLLHPADANGDWRVNQNEISASISRWKSAQEDLKTSVAIRGITLYLQGEQYVYSASVPAEAKRWIPVGDPLGACAAAPLFMAFSILQPGVVRNVQSNIVTLAVTPPEGTRAYGMEEIVGPGVVVGSISHEGTWDPTSRKIRWAFYDGASRALSYTVSGPEGLRVTLMGLASFDGSEDGVTGATSAVVPLSFQTWAQSKGLAGAAAAFEASDLASGEPNGLLYAFGSNLAEGESVIDILWQDGVLVIETPAQDPATEAFVLLTVEGASELGAPAWTISLEPAADQSSTPENRCRWIPLLPPPSTAFFRVKAILK